MKRLSYILLILWVLTGTVLGQLSPHIYNVELKPYEGTFSVSFDLELPRKMVRSSESLILYPLLISGNDPLELPPVAVHGKNRAKVLSRSRSILPLETADFLQEITLISNSTPLIRYRLDLPLPDEMQNEMELTLVGKLIGCNKERVLFSMPLVQAPLPVASVKKEPVRIQPRVAFVIPELTIKEREETGRAYLDFPSGGAQILPHYRNNPAELSRIRESIERTYRDKDITIRGIYLTGYASPESSYAFNQQLSQNRAQNLKNYMRREYGLPEQMLHVLPGGEDWKGLRELVEESSLWQKEETLTLIDSYGDPDWKEQRLKSMGALWHRMMEEIFPRLRRVEYRIEYQIRDYSPGESEILLGKDPGKLSPYELYQLAKKYPEGSEDWNDILLLSARLYPGDEIPAINALAIRLTQGDFEKAGKHAEALALSTRAEALNNRGIYLLQQGNTAGAASLFQKAAESGSEEAVFNLQEIHK